MASPNAPVRNDSFTRAKRASPDISAKTTPRAITASTMNPKPSIRRWRAKRNRMKAAGNTAPAARAGTSSTPRLLSTR